MKAMQIVRCLVLASILLLGNVGYVLAAGPPEASPTSAGSGNQTDTGNQTGSGNQTQGMCQGFFGNVTAADGQEITLVTNQGWTVNLTLVETTRYMVPAIARERVRFQSLVQYLGGDITSLIGKRVAASACDIVKAPGEDVFTGTARHIIVLPDPLVRVRLHAHHVGLVTDFQQGPGGHITILDIHSANQNFSIGADTIYLPNKPEPVDVSELIGSFATVIATSDLVPVVKAIIVHPTVPQLWPTPTPTP
jgi:hypothetical protein